MKQSEMIYTAYRKIEYKLECFYMLIVYSTFSWWGWLAFMQLFISLDVCILTKIDYVYSQQDGVCSQQDRLCEFFN